MAMSNVYLMNGFVRFFLLLSHIQVCVAGVSCVKTEKVQTEKGDPDIPLPLRDNKMFPSQLRGLICQVCLGFYPRSPPGWVYLKHQPRINL